MARSIPRPTVFDKQCPQPNVPERVCKGLQRYSVQITAEAQERKARLNKWRKTQQKMCRKMQRKTAPKHALAA